MVNKTSYVENCETSAVGRALGFFGIGVDENICSAQELLYAIQAEKQNAPEQAPSAPVVQKGGAIYPAKEPEPAKPEKKSGAELEEIYGRLSQREFDEYNDAVKGMKAQTTRAGIVGVYNRFREAVFAPLLLDVGNSIIKERGL